MSFFRVYDAGMHRCKTYRTSVLLRYHGLFRNLNCSCTLAVSHTETCFTKYPRLRIRAMDRRYGSRHTRNPVSCTCSGPSSPGWCQRQRSKSHYFFRFQMVKPSNPFSLMAIQYTLFYSIFPKVSPTCRFKDNKGDLLHHLPILRPWFRWSSIP